MPALKVVIADDHPIVLLGMSHIIERDTRFTLVGEAVSSSQLIDLLHQHQPEVVITDFNMPGDEVYGDGLKMIEYIIRHFPATQILVLTMLSNILIAARLEALGVGVIEAFGSFWASAFKEVIVFTLILPVLLFRSLSSKHSDEDH
mgnify:CR=1 FL=1